MCHHAHFYVMLNIEPGFHALPAESYVLNLSPHLYSFKRQAHIYPRLATFYLSQPLECRVCRSAPGGKQICEMRVPLEIWGLFIKELCKDRITIFFIVLLSVLFK